MVKAMAPNAPIGAAFMYADDGEQRVAGLIDDAEQDLSSLTEHLQAKRKQDCEEKHLQDLALSECPHHRVGDDVH
jgi:hypothetical protein